MADPCDWSCNAHWSRGTRSQCCCTCSREGPSVPLCCWRRMDVCPPASAASLPWLKNDPNQTDRTPEALITPLLYLGFGLVFNGLLRCSDKTIQIPNFSLFTQLEMGKNDDISICVHKAVGIKLRYYPARIWSSMVSRAGEVAFVFTKPFQSVS